MFQSPIKRRPLLPEVRIAVQAGGNKTFQSPIKRRPLLPSGMGSLKSTLHSVSIAYQAASSFTLQLQLIREADNLAKVSIAYQAASSFTLDKSRAWWKDYPDVSIAYQAASSFTL